MASARQSLAHRGVPAAAGKENIRYLIPRTGCLPPDNDICHTPLKRQNAAVPERTPWQCPSALNFSEALPEPIVKLRIWW